MRDFIEMVRVGPDKWNRLTGIIHISRGDNGLSRLEGGIGGRGPGEQKLEIDRRRVRDRIRNLEKRLVSEPCRIAAPPWAGRVEWPICSATATAIRTSR